MATFKDGINGSFKGKIGGVVGYKWKGIWVMRSRPKHNQDREWSPLQKANHARMRVMQQFLSPNLEFLRRGFGMVPELERMSAYNAAMSYNKLNAIKGEYPDFEIDFSQVVFAKGDLANQEDLKVSQVENELRFSWIPLQGESAAIDDQLMVLLSYKGQTSASGIVSGPQRMTGRAALDVVHINAGIEVHIHVAFISDDRKRVSDSLYKGCIILS